MHSWSQLNIPYSLRCSFRRFRDYVRFIIPELLVISGSVLILLALIDKFFIRRR